MSSSPNALNQPEAEQLRRRNRELSILNAFAQALNRSVDLDQALCTTLAQVTELLDLHTRAAEIGLEAGLRYVYAGNLPGGVGEYEHTLLPPLSPAADRALRPSHSGVSSHRRGPLFPLRHRHPRHLAAARPGPDRPPGRSLLPCALPGAHLIPFASQSGPLSTVTFSRR